MYKHMYIHFNIVYVSKLNNIMHICIDTHAHAYAHAHTYLNPQDIHPCVLKIVTLLGFA